MPNQNEISKNRKNSRNFFPSFFLALPASECNKLGGEGENARELAKFENIVNAYQWVWAESACQENRNKRVQRELRASFNLNTVPRILMCEGAYSI